MTNLKHTFFILLIPVLIVILLTLFSIRPTYSQQLICSERTKVLQNLKESFNEELSEQGVTDQGFLLSLAIAPDRKWTMLMVTKENPYSYCIVASGTKWEQGETASTGIAYGGNLVSIGFDDHGNWSMIVIQSQTDMIVPAVRGHGWERIINLNIQKQSL
tara:strand:+ start:655 stop:1134 length:480 start_codon:yes stop_codon:yes gene_type:complete